MKAALGKRTAGLVLGAYFLLAALFYAGGNPATRLYGAGDGFTAGLPSMLFSTRLTGWNPYVQLGQPTLPNTQYQALYPPTLLLMSVLPPTLGYNAVILLHYVLAGFFFFLFARNLRLPDYAAFLGGAMFLLSGFLAAHKGHHAMLSTAAWLPLMLYFIDRYAETLRVRELAFCSVAAAMAVLAGFPQIALYSLLLLAAYAAFRFAGAPPGRRLVRFLGAMAFVGTATALLASFQLAAIAEALPQVTREKLTYSMFCEDYFPAYHLFAFIFPNLFGGLYGVPSYSTTINFVEVYSYMGLLPLALAIAVFGSERRARRDVRFWGVAAAAALLVSLGAATPLYRLLYFVPVYNLFRAPARHLFEIHFAVSVLFAFAVERIFRPGDACAFLRRTAWTLAILFAAGFAATRAVWLAFALLQIPALRALDGVTVNALWTVGAVKAAALANLNTAHRTMLLPFVFFLFSLAMLAVLARTRRNWTRAALPVLLAADLFTVHTAIYHHPDTRVFEDARLHPEVGYLRSHADPRRDRILPLEPELTYTYPLLNMMFGLSAVNDYSPMWLKRYQAATGFTLNGTAPFDTVTNTRLMSLAGMRYVVTGSASMREQLRTAAAVPAEETIAPVASGPQGWQLADAAAAPDGAFRLQARPGTPVSLLQLPVRLRPDSTCVVRFQARAPAGGGLMVDLYGGPAYDAAAQDRTLTRIAPGYTAQAVAIGTGSAPPEQAWLRIFTTSAEPVEVRDVRVGMAARAGKPYLEEVFSTPGGIAVFRNPDALPRFRFARELLPARDAADALGKVLDGSFDPQQQAVVEGLAAPIHAADGEIVSREVRDSRLRFRLRTGGAAFFIVADSWYPGWRAYLDGAAATIYPVDGFLRGVRIAGAGEHRLEMVYRPASLYYGAAGTLAGLLLVAAAMRKRG